MRCAISEGLLYSITGVFWPFEKALCNFSKSFIRNKTDICPTSFSKTIEDEDSGVSSVTTNDLKLTSVCLTTTDSEDRQTVWEACKHPLSEQVVEKSCPIVFASKLGLTVFVIFQIFICIAFLPHWSICQEHKEVNHM